MILGALLRISWMLLLVLAAAALLVAAGCDEPRQAGARSAAAPPETSITAALEAVDHYLAAGDAASALAVAERLVESAPDDGRAHVAHGRVLLTLAVEGAEAGDLDALARRRRAYEAFAAAVAADPGDAALHQSAGSLAWSIGEREAALDHFHGAAAADPLNPQHPLFAAQVQIEAARYADARAELDRVLELDPQEPVAWASLAVIALESPEPRRALEHIARARELDPGNLDLRVQEARIHRRLGDPQRSVALLGGLDDQQRSLARVAAELAAAWAAIGDHERRAAAWIHRYRLAPDDPAIWRAAVEVGHAMLDAGKPDEAHMWLRQARLSAPPEAPEVRALEARLGS